MCEPRDVASRPASLKSLGQGPRPAQCLAAAPARPLQEACGGLLASWSDGSSLSLAPWNLLLVLKVCSILADH